MNKRSREYFKWLRYLKEQELAYYNSISYKLEFDLAMETFISANDKLMKNGQVGYLTFGVEDGERFIGMIPYLRAMERGDELSRFQHSCFNMAIGRKR